MSSTEEEKFCSFCNKSNNNVKKMIFGPNGNICNECLDISYEIIYNKDAPESKSNAPINDFVELPSALPPTPSLSEQLKAIDEFEENISNELFGQTLAKKSIISSLTRSIYRPSAGGPKGVLLFLGPPATGKTTLAKLIAKYTPGYSEDNVLTYDMSQFSHDFSTMELIGAEKVWTGGRPGQMTLHVKQNPRTVIIFDEFEKADNAVQDQLLPLFSEGMLTDKYTLDTNEESKNPDPYLRYKPLYTKDGKLIVDFSETIVIITTNLGSELYNSKKFKELLEHNPLQAQSSIIEAIGREEKHDTRTRTLIPAITPPMLSRLGKGKIALFETLKFSNMLKVCQLNFDKEVPEFEDGFELVFDYGNTKQKDKIITALLLANGPLFDIRRIKNNLPSQQLFNPIIKLIREGYKKKPKKVSINIDKQCVESINEILAEYGDDILHQMHRRNKTLDIDIKSHINEKNVIQLDINSATIKQLPKSIDYDGDLGLSVENPDVSWDDVKGHIKVKERLKNAVTNLKNPELITQYGVDLPKGILLYGPPGTGKTMLAKALANEADLPFIPTTGKDLLEKNKDGVSNIKIAFKRAKEYAPSIIFIDEIDAFPIRGEQGGFYDNRLNELLTEINGFAQDDNNSRVFIIAATNRLDMLDPALIRPGRIGVHIEVAQLDRMARSYFIEKWLKNDVIDFAKEEIEKLITLTTGLNGSQLEKVEREAVIKKVQEDVGFINIEMLIELVNSVRFGNRNQKENIAEMLQETAIHEASHAVAIWYLTPDAAIEQITIVSRERAAGFVTSNYEKTAPDYNRTWFMSYTCVCLAGRAAQMKKFGKKGLDAGASSDLENAMKFAYQAVSELGMDDELFNINTHAFKEFFNIELFKDENEKRIKHWIDKATQLTNDFVNEHWDEIEQLSDQLLKEEILFEEDVVKTLKGRPDSSTLLDIF